MRVNKSIVLNSTDSIFFTADTHFSHENVIRYNNRPFTSVEDMNCTMADNWNRIVSPTSIIFILGDFCFGGTGIWVRLLDSLNGIKYLILGNHDKGITPNKFKKVDNLMNLWIKDDDVRFTLCHYPMLSWYQSNRGAYQLYGHVHGRKMNTTEKQLDVGVDVNNYSPISYNTVMKLLNNKQNG